jgi:8-oxo-dGTP pyrophosphatase MutT (NUDIX family)
MTIVSPRPASTVCLLRDRRGAVEVFMVKRHTKSTFMPDVFVFPGGSVVDDDRAVENTPGACTATVKGATALGSGLRAAAIRECFEEAGVLLARRATRADVLRHEDLAHIRPYRDTLQRGEGVMSRLLATEDVFLATDLLHYWAHWITPETSPVRFDTHFFLAAMPAHQSASSDGLETSGDTWITPETALSAHHSGQFPLVIATATQLEALVGFASVSNLLSTFARATVRTVRPRVVVEQGEDTIVLEYES